MKTKKNATLRKLGMILAVALLFSALAVPVWAEGEDGVGTAGAADAQPGGTVPADSADAAGSTADPQTAAQNDTTSVPDPTAPGTSEANPDTTAIQPRESEQGGNGGDNSGGNSNSGSEVTPPVEPNVPVAGDLYVTGYTVLNEIGGVELQRIEANQKCTIIVSVADTRFVNFVDEPAIREYLGTQNEAIANIKVTSTASFSPPSIDYIYTRSEEFKQEDRTLRYVIVLEGITYLGGENKLSLDIGYKKGALELKSVTQAISR